MELAVWQLAMVTLITWYHSLFTNLPIFSFETTTAAQDADKRECEQPVPKKLERILCALCVSAVKKD
jgi:hypothetical protein